MKRRSFLATTAAVFGGCMGRGGYAEREVYHKEGEPKYLGTHESHEIGFEKINFVLPSNLTENPEIHVYFGREISLNNKRSRIFFYRNGEIVGAGVQNLETYSLSNKEFDPIVLPSLDKMKDFTAYRVAILNGEIPQNKPSVDDPADDTLPLERCEAENVSPQNDDPMDPNCNTNPYGPPYESGGSNFEHLYLKPIEGYEPIQTFVPDGSEGSQTTQTQTGGMNVSYDDTEGSNDEEQGLNDSVFGGPTTTKNSTVNETG